MIKIYVCGQNVSGEYSPIASDSINYLEASFSFSPDWYGLEKTAQFTQNGKTYNVLLEKNKCLLPSELAEGFVDISVFGQKPDDARRITTLPFSMVMKKSAFVSDGDTPIPPTPDLYSQFIGRVNDAVSGIPSKLSEFENDAGFVTEKDLPRKTSEIENDSGFITLQDIPEAEVPTRLSELENDAGYIAPNNVGQLSISSSTVDISGDSITIGETSYGFLVSGNRIQAVGTPEDNTDAATKGYVDNKVTEFDTVITTVAEWEAFLASDSAINILVKPKEDIILAAETIIPPKVRYIKFCLADGRFVANGDCVIACHSASASKHVIVDSFNYSSACDGVAIKGFYKVINSVCAISDGNKIVENCGNIETVSQARLVLATDAKKIEKSHGVINCAANNFNTCRNVFGCMGNGENPVFESCDTIVYNMYLANATFTNCTNVIKEKTALSELENDSGFITLQDIPEVEVPSKLSELENDAGLLTVNYDKIINSQADWDEMVASENWGGATNVYLNCDVVLGRYDTMTDFRIPDNVCLINAGGHSIKSDYMRVYGGENTIVKNAHFDTKRGYIYGFYALIGCSFVPEYVYSNSPAQVRSIKHFVNCDYSNVSDGIECTELASLTDCKNIWLTTSQAKKFDTSDETNGAVHVVDNIPAYAYPSNTSQLGNDAGYATTAYVDGLVGDVESALDSIIALQTSMIGGESV